MEAHIRDVVPSALVLLAGIVLGMVLTVAFAFAVLAL